MNYLQRFIVPAALFALVWPVSAAAQNTPIHITADLTEAARKIYHAEIDLPVKPGPLALTTPQWIPGNHRPTGPAEAITGVVFTAGGKALEWRRDDVDLYVYHVVVPAGVSKLHAHLDCIATERVTQRMAVLEWEKLLLYPAHTPVASIAIQPAVRVPAGWGIGTALKPVGSTSYPIPPAGATTEFEATTVEQLQDSPLITGAHFHEYALAPEIKPAHYLDVVADAAEDAELRPAFLASVNNLVREADALYASHHYNVYHFLLTLSDIAGGEGLEHGQSSDNGVGEKGYADEAHQLREADLLSHEFTHSWNGKYRRPVGLYQPDFATPQQGALLWVYEGMTQYLGEVLAARSGLETQAQFRDALADTAASLDNTTGRVWRSTADTAIAASILRGGNPAWSNWRRSQDYYPEGVLLWLDADTQIRKLTDGRKSLDDFARIFLGKGGNTGPMIVTYDFKELVADLNAVAPYDWATFLDERVNHPRPHADFEGIERSGYRVQYVDTPSASSRMIASAGGGRGASGFWYSLGLRMTPEGRLVDVRWGSAADKAELAPGARIVAVNGNVFSGEALHDAIRSAKNSTDPIHLIVQNDTFVTSVDVVYHDGERYPQLTRIDGEKAVLEQITAPLTAPKKTEESHDNSEKK